MNDLRALISIAMGMGLTGELTQSFLIEFKDRDGAWYEIIEKIHNDFDDDFRRLAEG
jgi:hypothetical protein